MRVGEWVCLIAFLPALLLSFQRIGRKRWWNLGAALLPALALLPHLIIEGWRTQMVPLYLLALLVGGAGLTIWRRQAEPRSRRRFLLPSLLALALLGGGLLPGWLLPVFSLPAPTGPYHVGIVDREVVDEARGRHLMVSIWYPAATVGPPAKLLTAPDPVAAGITKAFGVPLAAPLLQHLRYVNVAASSAVPIATAPNPFPVLIFSHGLVGARFQNSATMQELASWGYIVIALDHTDAAAVTVFPNGEVRDFNLQRLGISPDEAATSTEQLLPIWVADQRLLYDRLTTWATTDPLLSGKIDLQRIGSFGHSFGGATAVAVCQIEPRCQAAADLDGGVSGKAPAAHRPLLLLTASASGQLVEANAHWSRLLREATGPAYWLELPNTNHYSLTILPLLSPLSAPPGSDSHATMQTIDRYLRAFFDLHLQGLPTPLLDPAAPTTEVRWHPK